MLPLVLITPVVVVVKILKAAIVPAEQLVARRRDVKWAAAVLLAASVPLTLLLATSRVTSPPARTPRLAPVMAPAAFCDTPPADECRTVAVPALTAACKL